MKAGYKKPDNRKDKQMEKFSDPFRPFYGCDLSLGGVVPHYPA
jgi:hypothetical protein